MGESLAVQPSLRLEIPHRSCGPGPVDPKNFVGPVRLAEAVLVLLSLALIVYIGPYQRRPRRTNTTK
jgi:hypothetical protein